MALKSIVPTRAGGSSKGIRHVSSVPKDDPIYLELVKLLDLRDRRRESKRAELEWGLACKEFLADNRGLAIRFAQDFTRSKKPDESVVEAAEFGMLDALHRFDKEKAHRFSTFANWRMTHACQQLGMRANITSVSREDRRNRREYEEAIERLKGTEIDDDQLPPSDDQILADLREREEKLRKAAFDRGDRPRDPRWSGVHARSLLAAAKVAIEVGYAEIDENIDEGADPSSDELLDLKRGLTQLSSKERSAVAVEYDLGVDVEVHFSDPLEREIIARIAVKKLKKLLDLRAPITSPVVQWAVISTEIAVLTAICAEHSVPVTECSCESDATP